MRKSTVIWLAVATLLVVLGAVIFVCVMSVYEWDFSKLSTVEYETNEYTFSEEYKDIWVVTNEADIVFEIAEGEETKVVCYEDKNCAHSVSVNNGTLAIDVVDTRKWYEHIGINFSSPKIAVYIPAGEYGELSIKTDTGDVVLPKELSFGGIDVSSDTGEVTNYASAIGDVSIKTSTGDVFVENVTAENLQIFVSTGKVSLTSVQCKNFTSSGDTGDVYLSNVIASDKISVTRDTGDVRFDSSDAEKIVATTETGDVSGTLLSEKVFVAFSETGVVDVPETERGGKCEITSTTGSIIIRIEE